MKPMDVFMFFVRVGLLLCLSTPSWTLRISAAVVLVASWNDWSEEK